MLSISNIPGIKAWLSNGVNTYNFVDGGEINGKDIVNCETGRGSETSDWRSD
jgi:hypothetical protein